MWRPSLVLQGDSLLAYQHPNAESQEPWESEGT